jgi:hypothetical protein
MKTLLFCTTYAGSPERWDLRVRKWLDYFSRSALRRDQILMVDDGSPTLPSWRGVRVLRDLPDRQPAEESVLFHFDENLGRSGVLNYPGWFRSFAFAAVYAQKYGFDKVVHIESDAFLYSDRIVAFVNGLSSGWTTFWCPRWNFPETCIQVICRDQLDRYASLSAVSYREELADKAIETLLPFTDIRKDFIGDRYGEYLHWVPEGADFGSQIPEHWPQMESSGSGGSGVTAPGHEPRKASIAAFQPSHSGAGDFVPYVVHRSAALRPEDDVLVYVAYCPDGRLTPLHLRCLKAYAAEGYRIALVINSGADDHTQDPGPNPAVIQIVRENIGFDFGGWGHGARLIDGLVNARSVTFANDSVIGPLPGDGSAELRQTIRDIEGDAVFMTESVQIRPHGQSYFFAFKQPALEKGAISVIQRSLYFSDRKRVVLNEELTLAARLAAQGISLGVAFPCPEAIQHGINPTFYFWDQLVSTGFPFVKVSLIPDGKVAIDAPDLAAIIGPDFLADLRVHLSGRPVPPALVLEANPTLIRR